MLDDKCLSCSSQATQSVPFMRIMENCGRTVSSVMWSLFWARCVKQKLFICLIFPKFKLNFAVVCLTCCLIVALFTERGESLGAHSHSYCKVSVASEENPAGQRQTAAGQSPTPSSFRKLNSSFFIAIQILNSCKLQSR